MSVLQVGAARLALRADAKGACRAARDGHSVRRQNSAPAGEVLVNVDTGPGWGGWVGRGCGRVGLRQAKREGCCRGLGVGATWALVAWPGLASLRNVKSCSWLAQVSTLAAETGRCGRCCEDACVGRSDCGSPDLGWGAGLECDMDKLGSTQLHCRT